MAGNEWINGYLEAILDAGERIDDHRAHDEGSDTCVLASTATKYFVEEVVGHDESALYNTWIKATKNTQERSGRLENLCWRIWHMTRKKKEIQWDDARQLAHHHMEREKGHKAATDDISEEMSEGESKYENPGGHSASSGCQIAAEVYEGSQVQTKQRHLYLVLISLHGLVRGDDMELGRDSDTGGQVKYVVEFARALAMMPEVYRVDLLTRQICSPDVDSSYGEPTEMLTSGTYDGGQELGESSGAYIIRIPCGPRDKYIRKELLWPYTQEFSDGALAHILIMAKALGEQLSGGEPVWPHVIHGHYADAGNIAALLSGALNVPMVLTGHSLGRSKLEQLLKQGRQSKEDINATYKIMRRIEAEEISLDTTELVITSTKQEIEQQWGLYDGFDVKLEKVLRARMQRDVSCHGRFMPRMSVIPPGMDFSNVVVHDASDTVESEIDMAPIANPDTSVVIPPSPNATPPIWDEIMRFLTNPHKPMILALARPDPKKNITTLLRAFGECRPLRELANLTLIMGNRDDIDEMAGGNGTVLTMALKLIDKYDLYGQVAYPKHHKQCDVPDIYRLAAKTKGVFVNPALVEPFGLTLIEAAAHGLPMVATNNGGPVDIHRVLNNGLLVDPHDYQGISAALLKLVADRSLWSECRRNGLKNVHLYSWPEHCRTYLMRIALCQTRRSQWQRETILNEGLEEPDSRQDSLRDATNISLQLSVDGEKLSLGSLSLSSLEDSEKGLGNCDLEDTHKENEENKEAVDGSNGSHLECTLYNGVNQMDGLLARSIQNLPAKVPFLIKKRKKLIVFAVDSYDMLTGKLTTALLQLIQGALNAIKRSNTRSVGFLISTALTVSKTLSMLSENGIAVQDFDALICGSGSQLHYPAVSASREENYGLLYDHHIDYRWNKDGIRKTMPRLLLPDGEEVPSKGERALVEDEIQGNTHLLTYRVTKMAIAPTICELRQRLRMRGLRCNVVYCQNATKLHVLPLFASRCQALRYLFVQWGLDIMNMYMIVGEAGDTDYEQLLGGMHKIVIIKDFVGGSSEAKLRARGKCHRGESSLSDSPNILTAETSTCESILDTLQKLGFKA